METTGFVDRALDFSIKHRTEWRGLGASTFFILMLSLGVFRLIPDGVIAFSNFMLCAILVVVIYFLYWAKYKWHFPKRGKKKLGVTIAIRTENAKQRSLLENDFLIPFKTKMAEINADFEIIELKPHQADAVLSKQDAQEVMAKTKAHFCIWGSLRKRPVGDNQYEYFFCLRGAVFHGKNIGELQRNLLIMEFSEILPYEVRFEEKLQLEKFEFRASQVSLAANYITGRAALLFKDVDTAIRIHEAQYQKMEMRENSPVKKSTLKNLLSLEYSLKTAQLINADASKQTRLAHSVKALEYNHANYMALIHRARIEFDDGRGSVEEALSWIKKASTRARGNNVWLYNEAFLRFYTGDYPAAIRLCDKIKNKWSGDEGRLVNEITEHTKKVITQTEKNQLYYWIGFVNLAKNGNVAIADEYFQKFVDCADESMKVLVQRASSYLVKTKREIGYS